MRACWSRFRFLTLPKGSTWSLLKLGTPCITNLAPSIIQNRSSLPTSAINASNPISKLFEVC